MSSLQLGFLAVYWSGRLFFYDMSIILSGRRVRTDRLLMRLGWAVLLILFAPTWLGFLWAFIIYAVFVFFDSYLRSRRVPLNYWIYLLQWVVLISAVIVLKEGIDSNKADNVFYVWRYFPAGHGLRYLLILDGFLLTQKEATIFIRLILQRLRAFPKKVPENRKKDQREYELGRVIGLLERVFLYFLIIWNQIGAIAVLIALKSLARYKELENKTFAEYFLIGSLLSILCAAIPAVIVRLMLH